MDESVTRIVVPMDFSETAKVGLEEAAELARYHHARVILLHVIQHQEGVQDPSLAEAWNDDEERVRRIQARLREIAWKVLGSDIPHQIVVLRGELVEKVVVDHARAIDAGIIVVGSHEIDTIQHPMQTSLAAEIARRADCRVVVARGNRRRSPGPDPGHAARRP